MLVSYANVRQGKPSGSLRYSCQRAAIDYGEATCQSLSGEVLESFVTERLMQVVEPASLELSLAASRDIERERKQLHVQWQQRLSRSAYEVEQARKSYAAVDPEHRLVAKELERRWDDALREQANLQADYERFQSEQPASLTAAQREQIKSLSESLPQLWQAATTTAADRCVIARLLIEQVVVSVEDNSERVDVDIHYSGGFRSHHALRRPVQTYEQLSYYDELLSRIKMLLSEGDTLGVIATKLNAAGYRPPKRSSQFNSGILTRFLRDRGIRTGRLPKSVTDQDLLKQDEWWLSDLAAELKMPIATLHRWQRVGWVTSRKVIEANRWAIYADASECKRLTTLRSSHRSWPDPYPRHLITPKPNPHTPDS